METFSRLKNGLYITQFSIQLIISFNRRIVIDEVLFSLLKRVREGSEQLPPGTDAATSNAGLMVHHSRNTAAKQWDETKSIALSGIIRVFCKTAAMTTRTRDFPDVWQKLMGVIKIQACDATNEVSLSGALAFQVCSS